MSDTVTPEVGMLVRPKHKEDGFRTIIEVNTKDDGDRTFVQVKFLLHVDPRTGVKSEMQTPWYPGLERFWTYFALCEEST